MLAFYCRDADFSSFEFANFLTGTHDDDEEKVNKVDTINLIRVRMPKLVPGQKTTIDYDRLDRQTHSKVQIVKKIPHEGEVLKCRANGEGTLIASILTTGVVNLYDMQDGSKRGNLQGLADESFCLDWNKRRGGLLVSAAGSTVCVWDVAANMDQQS